MIPFGSTDNWSWSNDAFPALWFCVRALVYIAPAADAAG
jgi:hypothetical protein